jgi:hypothetical protein
VLRYSDALTGILSKYRSSVEDALQRLNLSEHLAAIQAGIQSPNPAEWRSAVFSCRNLLSDLAGLLWQDSRSTYIHIRNDKGQEISVTPNAFSNRLGAYLHQKGIHGKSIGYLRTESERLAASIRSLVEFQGKAHDPMTLEEAETVASGTFFLIGEIALKTDLEPISQYGEPNEAT